jgi:hypothetical protein
MLPDCGRVSGPRGDPAIGPVIAMSPDLHPYKQVAALAGRRPDAPDAPESRFPLGMVGPVTQRIRHTLAEQRVETLVCSAACGADLLALEAADHLGIKCRVVLPFPPERFRKVSVIDRPGNWGVLFDRVIEQVRGTDDLIVLRPRSKDEASFAAATDRILTEAISVHLTLNRADPSVFAVVVWDGVTRGPDDATAGFRNAALRLGLPIVDIPTLEHIDGPISR